MRRSFVISFVILLLLFQPAWAANGCPSEWTSAGGGYQEGDTCKLRCAHPTEPDWWMDSGREPRPGCEAPHSPAPTHYDIWGDTQAPLCDCPEGFQPEHHWFEQDGTCLLKCVGTGIVDLLFGVGYPRRWWLDISIDRKQVMMDSRGESRPPWCILD